MEVRDWLKRGANDGTKTVNIRLGGERLDVMSVRR